MVLNFEKRYEPSVDPFKDTEVIDQRGPRTLQWLVALVALQLVVGLWLGRKFCLPCVLYFKVLQPRFGEGRIEDSRPPRFANLLGAVFTTSATVLFLVGLTTAGWAVTLLVTTLASLASISGICVGCELYAAIARARGVQLAS
jgi:hypothetical protein